MTCVADRNRRWSIVKAADLADWRRGRTQDDMSTIEFFIGDRCVGVSPPWLDLGHECEEA